MKPSTDYIDWMMAPEREDFRRRLNEEWEPEVGNWIVTADDPKTPQMVTVAADEGVYRTAKTRRELWEYRRHIRWLPDLGQLLGMIVEETAAGHLYFNMPTQIGEETGMYSTAAFRRDRPPIHYPLRQGERLYDYESVADEPEIATGSLLAKLWTDS